MKSTKLLSFIPLLAALAVALAATVATAQPAAGLASVATNWQTTGLHQANTMGAGEAAIPKNGMFCVFGKVSDSG